VQKLRAGVVLGARRGIVLVVDDAEPRLARFAPRALREEEDDLASLWVDVAEVLRGGVVEEFVEGAV